jgi:hypothetical protein
LLDPIASDWPSFVICKFKPTLVADLTFGTSDETTKKMLKWLVLEQTYSIKPRPVPFALITPLQTPAKHLHDHCHPLQTPSGRRLFTLVHLLYSIYVVNRLAEGKEGPQDT